MKKAVSATAVFIALSIFSSVSFCEDYLQFDNRIPDKPYFTIGDVIYSGKFASETSQDGVYYTCCRYIGFSDNSVRLRCEYEADDSLTMPHMPSESEVIIVPLDKKEKGYFSTYALPKTSSSAKVLPVKLVIGIYDRQKALITVSEYGLKHIPQRSGSTSYKKGTTSLLGDKPESLLDRESASTQEAPFASDLPFMQ